MPEPTSAYLENILRDDCMSLVWDRPAIAAVIERARNGVDVLCMVNGGTEQEREDCISVLLEVTRDGERP